MKLMKSNFELIGEEVREWVGGWPLVVCLHLKDCVAASGLR